MWRNTKPYWLVLPATAVILLLFAGGLWEGLLQSLGYFPAAGQREVSADAYLRLLRETEFWDSMWLTLRIALLSTLLAGWIGMFVAVCLFMIEKKGRGKSTRFWNRFFQFPLVLPHLVGAYLMVLLFTQSGWLARLLHAIGFLEQMEAYPVLVNEPAGWGIILTYAWKEAPFIALMLYPVLLRIHSSWLEVAQVLGAGRFAFFKEVLFPLMWPAWLSSSFLVFAFTFASFEVPYLLGVTYPKMLPVLAFDLYSGDALVNRPVALAVNLLLTLVTALLGLIAYFLSKRWSLGEGRGW